MQKGYAEYAKVYASLLIMAVFFSTLMTAPVQGARPRAEVAEGGDQVVSAATLPATGEGSSLFVRDVSKTFRAADGSLVNALDGLSLTVAGRRDGCR